MRSLVKILLFLLTLPLLLVIFGIVLIPLLIILLIGALLLPSGRGVRLYRFFPGQGHAGSQTAEPPEDDGVVDVECTVTDAEAEEPAENRSAGKPPELKE